MKNPTSFKILPFFVFPLLFSFPFFLRFGILTGDCLSGLLFLIGMYLGSLLLYADEQWLYDFYKEQESEVVHKQEQPSFSPRLITRSALFLLALIPLTIFVVTSSGSLLGFGMILGIQLGLVIEIWTYWKKSAQLQLTKIFQSRFLYDLKVGMSFKDIRLLAMGSTLFLVISAILTLL